MNSPLTPSLIGVAPGVHAWIGAGGASNAGIVETPQGLIAIDTQQSAQEGESLRSTVERRLGQRVHRVINSHFHLDHIAGNAAFADALIIAHERTGHLLRAMLGDAPSGAWQVSDAATKLKLFFGANFDELVSPQDDGFGWFMDRIAAPGCEVMPVLAPHICFADRLEIPLPSDVVLCTYHGPAHCDGDIIIHLPKSGILFLGDLLFVGRIPWLGDCNLDGWIRCLDAVLALDVHTVVPGHGPLATLRDVAAFRDLLAAIRSETAKAIGDGLSEDAAVGSIRLPQYAGLQRYDAWMPFNIRSAYRSMKGHSA